MVGVVELPRVVLQVGQIVAELEVDYVQEVVLLDFNDETAVLQ